MKGAEFCKISIISLYIFSTCFSIVWTLYSGAWCPYQTEKVIPCRIRNGSEPYYGPNICWRNDNGSYACTKKILYRPRYSTTYKRVLETKYKCCPGRSGMECEKECFNCTTYQKLEERVAATERRLSRLEYPKPTTERSERFHRDYMSQNSVYGPTSSKDVSPEASSLVYAALNSRVQKLLDEFRELHNRIRLIENEMSRINTQVDDLTLSNPNSNLGYNFDGDSNPGKDNDNNNKDSPDNLVTATTTGLNQKSIPSTTPRERRPGKTESAFRVLEENLERGDIASTLNDDYGDEMYNDNSTEQYIDQLQLKRERTSGNSP